MRHYFSARPKTAHPGGMLPAAAMGLLIALAGLAERLATRLSGAVAAAVDLPAVTAAAHDHLEVTPRAQEQTASPWPSLPVVADSA
jgi:hypothetical protein